MVGDVDEGGEVAFGEVPRLVDCASDRLQGLVRRFLLARWSRRALAEEEDPPTSAFACSRADDDAFAGILGRSSAFVTKSPRRLFLASELPDVDMDNISTDSVGAAFS